jgi:hypothetical protein
MATVRTIRAETPGPVRVHSDLPAADILVVAETGRDVGELTISTDDDSGPSADAVRNATLAVDGQNLRVRITGEGPGGAMVVQTGRGVSVSFGGSVVIGGSNYGTVVNGQVISPGGDGVAVIKGGSRIVVTVHVPESSELNAHSVSGSIETRGLMAVVYAESTSGEVIADRVGKMRARTVTGNITVDNLGEHAEVSSTSGSIRVFGRPGAYGRAKTVSGNIYSGGGMQLDGRSVSGRIRVR